MKRRRHPKFYDTPDGHAAVDKYVEKLTQEALREQERSLSDAIFDPRHAALKTARAADEGVEIVPGWDREAVLAVMHMKSAETTNAALARATWALVAATVALALATVLLIIVTARA